MKNPPTYHHYEVLYDGVVVEKDIQATSKKNVVDFIRREYIHDGFIPHPKGKRYLRVKFKIVKKITYKPMETKLSKEDELYNKIEQICLFLNEKKDAGYVLLEEDNKIIKERFVFSSPFNEKCIALHEENSKCWSNLLTHNKCENFGCDTLLKEYKEGLKYLKSLKFIHPQDIMNVKDLLIYEELI